MPSPTETRPQASVFYSWQSDLPNGTNRGLIQEALERAAKSIRADNTVAVEPVIDRDTQNVPGSPDIAHTIFQKIDRADAFVADVSIINSGSGRPTPNPNVLVELGYALKALGPGRTILVANTAYGPLELLPFDLRMKRVLKYELIHGQEGKAEQRKPLQVALEAALRDILNKPPAPPPDAAPSLVDKAVQSIETGAPSQAPLCNRFMAAFCQRTRELTPKHEPEKQTLWDVELVEAIRQTLPVVTDFARLADAAAMSNSREAVFGLFRGFADLFLQYDLPPGVGGHHYTVQFDLPKFVGHELMVILYAALIAARRWDTVAALCRETVLIPDSQSRLGDDAVVTFIFASEYLELLEHRNQKLQANRSSLHADLLKERHVAGRLGELAPWRQFVEADMFLYLRSVVSSENFSAFNVWRPWTAIYLRGAPSFLVEATQREKAEQLLAPLGVMTLPDLRRRVERAPDGLRQLFGRRTMDYTPFEGFRADQIGTR